MRGRISAVVMVWALAGGESDGPRPDADLCVVPPGGQAGLLAKFPRGMGETKTPVPRSSKQTRRFFNHCASQIQRFGRRAPPNDIRSSPPTFPTRSIGSRTSFAQTHRIEDSLAALARAANNKLGWVGRAYPLTDTRP
jgi:hypothetical protein